MPLKAGVKNIGRNISEMEAAGHPRRQAVAAALRTAYDRAAGGAVTGDTPGRADAVKLAVPEGAHVIPADVVAALGDGNNAAGQRVLSHMFPAKLAAGGATVPIMASDGEFVVSPEAVKQAGGHEVLNHFIMHTRSTYAQKLNKLPGPVQ
jgi:hypothetical protein